TAAGAKPAAAVDKGIATKDTKRHKKEEKEAFQESKALGLSVFSSFLCLFVFFVAIAFFLLARPGPVVRTPSGVPFRSWWRTRRRGNSSARRSSRSPASSETRPGPAVGRGG